MQPAPSPSTPSSHIQLVFDKLGFFLLQRTYKTQIQFLSATKTKTLKYLFLYAMTNFCPFVSLKTNYSIVGCGIMYTNKPMYTCPYQTPKKRNPITTTTKLQQQQHTQLKE
jgi:hypothetical protein